MVLLNLRIALKVYGEHATPSSAAATASEAQPNMFMHKHMSGCVCISDLTWICTAVIEVICWFWVNMALFSCSRWTLHIK